MLTLLHSPIVHGVLSGVLAAAMVDLHAFLAWKKFQEAAAYDWSTAAFRWFQGAVVGGLTAAGLSVVA